MRRTIGLAISALVIIGCGVGFWLFGGQRLFTSAPQEQAPPNADIHSLGFEGVEVTEIWSPICVHCLSFHTERWPQIEREYVSSGKARWHLRAVPAFRDSLWRDAPLADEFAVGVLTLLECETLSAGEYYSRLSNYAIAYEPIAARAAEPDIRPLLSEAARAMGLTQAQADACLADHDAINRVFSEVRANTESAVASNIDGAPSFIIGEAIFAEDTLVARLNTLSVIGSSGAAEPSPVSVSSNSSSTAAASPATESAALPPPTQRRPASPPASDPAPATGAANISSTPSTGNGELLTGVTWTSRPDGNDVMRYYPQRAQEREQQGRVQMLCQIQEGGSITCLVDSEDPAGWGFGEAALRVARHYRAAPTTDTGESTAGKTTRVVIRFRLAGY